MAREDFGELAFKGLAAQFRQSSYGSGSEHQSLEEAVFLEDASDRFTRVVAVGGRDYDEYFVLHGELSLELTFSQFTDQGELFTLDDRNLPEYRLLFNGLQRKPVQVVWRPGQLDR